jgi:hypothetical protein
VTAVSEQGRHLVELRSPQTAEPERVVTEEDAPPQKRWDFHLPSLRGVTTLGRTAREERAEEKERQKELASVEAAEQAFYETPAGRARLAYKRGHRLFQYELAINELEPTVIPGLVGSPARETTDPVDILNSVTVEGWKLVTGKFIHSELRHGVVGCYLFKRSQKRHLTMNKPWLDPNVTR